MSREKEKDEPPKVVEFVVQYVASAAATGVVAIEAMNLLSKLP